MKNIQQLHTGGYRQVARLVSIDLKTLSHE